MEDKEVSDGKSEIESKSLLGDNEGATEGSGLVTALDDIPEEEFLKMIGSDVIAGSHDPDDPMPTGYDDVTTGCSEEYQFDVTEMSCDLDDVTKGSHDRGLRALILTPTRELALQVQTHIRNVAKHTGIQVCTLIGGMAGVKQERVLSQHPPIVVATPGRLWKLMSEGHPHLTSLDSVRYLVLDEADRMIEFGHYQELAWILERINGAKGVESGAESEGRNWQTFVFSATLTLPRRSAEKKRKDRRRKNLSGQESVDNLISMVGLRDNPAVVDVTTQSGTVETLSEMKIMCSAEEKDAYLYYFLLLYSGQTLVFVNSISTLHKLHSLLSLLHLRPLLLHAHMQQRQRLKNFDRFSSSSTGLLLASDVAARGLDFPDVHHVIHYHVPRNSELYIHRSGRTARAKREGLSVILIGPEEMTSYRNICKTLNRDDIPTFPMDTMYLQAIRKRVSVARRIESALHKRKKRQRDSDWLRSSAQAMELELDRDWYGTETASTATNTQEANRVQSLKVELEGLLQAPIIPRSVSMAYPTCDENHKLLDGLKGDARPAERCNQIVAMETRDALQIAKTETSRRQKRKKTK
jgi:ATP-dependent RNA helicase DDX24/MAK5